MVNTMLKFFYTKPVLAGIPAIMDSFLECAC
jgi:hypothetical protein